MDNKRYKEILKTAREAVKDEKEPFKTEAFKIILSKLLEADEESKNKEQETSKAISIPKKSSIDKEYKGIVGGIKFLIDHEFLNQPRSMREIFNELKKEGYYYSLQSVDTTLRKQFVFVRKTITRTKSGSVWKYAIRK